MFLYLVRDCLQQDGEVSVPCRGLTCFYYDEDPYENCGKSFRPLSGSYMFLWICKCVWHHIQVVSVPCRGLTCFYSTLNYLPSRCHVSVPCRGLTCFYGGIKNEKLSVNLFPSPVGVLHVSIYKIENVSNSGVCFRPLSGSYMFLCGSVRPHRRYGWVSVPCRGLTCFYPAFCNALISRITQCICGWNNKCRKCIR